MLNIQKTGTLFSRLYHHPESPLSDSARFRGRLLGYYTENLFMFAVKIVAGIQKETGIHIQYFQATSGMYHPNMKEFFEKCELRDLLDAITVIHNVLVENDRMKALAGGWKTFVERALREEGMAYRVTDNGSVQYLVDETFEQSRISIIASLSKSKYSGVLSSVEVAFSNLASTNAKPKEAIRSIFDALESFVKTLLGTNKHFNEDLIKRELSPQVQVNLENKGTPAKSAALQYLSGLVQWTNACHIYRHGHNNPEVVDPPLPIAIALVEQGANYLRFIASILVEK